LLGNGAQKPAPFDMHLTLLVQIAQRAGKRVIVDSKGPAFEMAVRHARPWCIKPNIEEAEALLHRGIRDEKAEQRAVEELLALGVKVVLLSCGERGAYLGTGQGIYFLQSPRVHEVSAVGSGDAFVGAFASRILAGDDLRDAAKWGVAAGAANAMQSRSAFCSRPEIEALLGEVIIKSVD
jgi:fructose-1-phosphate kinase PfkB-like protein